MTDVYARVRMRSSWRALRGPPAALGHAPCNARACMCMMRASVLVGIEA